MVAGWLVITVRAERPSERTNKKSAGTGTTGIYRRIAKWRDDRTIQW
jgi:hypothetical protein